MTRTTTSRRHLRLIAALTIVLAADASSTPQQGQVTGGDTAGFAQAPIHLDAAQRQVIGLTFGRVERGPVEKVIRTVGRFDYDERKVAEVTLKVSGYIQDLYVDFTGQPVKKGDPLFSLYSPDLVTAQQEYLLAKEGVSGLARSQVTGARESAAFLRPPAPRPQEPHGARPLRAGELGGPGAAPGDVRRRRAPRPARRTASRSSHRRSRYGPPAGGLPRWRERPAGAARHHDRQS